MDQGCARVACTWHWFTGGVAAFGVPFCEMHPAVPLRCVSPPVVSSRMNSEIAFAPEAAP